MPRDAVHSSEFLHGHLTTVIAVSTLMTVGVSLIEIVILYFERRAHPLLRLSRDFYWMAPIALVAATTAAMTPCAFVASVWPRRLTLALVLFVPATLAYLDLLMLVPRLSHYAAAVMAAGLSAQTVRIVFRHPARARQQIRRLAPALLVCFAAVTGYLWRASSLPARRAAAVRAAETPARHTNVLLITLDTVRASHLSLHGYSRPTTPRLDRFAERGVIFENAFAAAPWTLPSHASLFTGRWPHELSADYGDVLDDTFPTVAGYLAGHGYATAGFAANLGYCSYESGLGRGFDHYEDYPRSLGQVAYSSTLVRNIADNFNLRRVLQYDQHLNRVSAAELNAHVLSWMTPRAASPFFVFINYFDAHEPYLPPAPFDRRFGSGRKRGQYSPLHRWLWDVSVAHRPMTPDDLREEIDAYDSGLAYLDDQVGTLLDELARRHVLDDTLVVITADHGEEFGEHGVFEHGYTLYRQALQVPLLVVFPGRVAAGRRVTNPVSLRDVPATIVDLVGLRAGAPFPGDSLSVLWSGQPPTTEPRAAALLSEVSRVAGQPEWFPASKGAMKSLLYRGFHYIRNGDGVEELYAVDADPAERTNLAAVPDHLSDLAESRQRLKTLIGEAAVSTAEQRSTSAPK